MRRSSWGVVHRLGRPSVALPILAALAALTLLIRGHR